MKPLIIRLVLLVFVVGSVVGKTEASSWSDEQFQKYEGESFSQQQKAVKLHRYLYERSLKIEKYRKEHEVNSIEKVEKEKETP